MAYATPFQPIPGSPRRIVVAGACGAGKTTVAREIAAILDIPHIETDGLYHGPDWTPRTEFEADVGQVSSSEAWVMEWQYDSVRPLLAERADLMVWLDLPWAVTYSRVIRRTLRRSRNKEVLWAGNVEPPLTDVFRDSDHILRHARRSRLALATLVPQAIAHNPRLWVVRLPTQKQVERWLAGPLTDVSPRHQYRRQ
jgi:adenylate kinase family enzyme